MYKSQNLPLYFKQIFGVTVTELFVFYNETVRGISKNIRNQLTLKNFLALFTLCITTFN